MTTTAPGSVGDTGSVSTDCYNNIYDLAGNVREWSMEAVDTTRRVYRGGYFNGAFAVSYRSINYQTSNGDAIGFRPALYIK